MIKGQDIVDKARSMIGTPFHHQARKPGLDGGIDCVGLAVCIARELGIEVQDRTDYARETDGEILRQSLEAHCDQVERMKVGDLVQFLRGRSTWHVAIVSRLGAFPMMIHARVRPDGGGEVREDDMDASWIRGLVGVWRYKDLKHG